MFKTVTTLLAISSMTLLAACSADPAADAPTVASAPATVPTVALETIPAPVPCASERETR